MSSPFVCEVCGADIMIGRHRSGWRHAAEGHSDHRVKKVAREDYKKRNKSDGTSNSDSGMEGDREKDNL